MVLAEDSDVPMFDYDAMAKNQARIRAKMREIIAKRDREHRKYSRPGECRACAWQCRVNNKTCVVDGDEARYINSAGQEDWGFEHWCVTHNREGRRKNG